MVLKTPEMDTMRKGLLGSLTVLLLTAGLAQAQQWAPYYPPAYPPQYMAQYPQYMAHYPQYTGYPGAQVAAYPGYPYPAAQQVAAQEPAAQQPAATAEPEANCPTCRPGAAQHVVPVQAAAATYSDVDSPGHACSPQLDNYVGGDTCMHAWLSLEYLYWWAKAAPSTVPLATSGSPADAIPGAIGQPHTSVLVGGSDINLSGANGFRLTIGGWLDSDNKFGLEASGFILENAVTNYNYSSGSVLAVPINVNGGTFANGPNAVPLINPNTPTLNPLNSGSTNPAAIPTMGPYIGSINIAIASQLYGGEFNAYYNLFRCPAHCGGLGASVDVLGGFRFLSLQESMSSTAVSTDTTLGVTNTYNDSFQASNMFYGGQLGVRADFTYWGFSLSGSLKAAFGINNETVSVNGSTIQNGPGGTSTYAGGIFTQPSNIGSQHQTNYSFVPQINLKIGYDLTPNVRVFAGYDFLYWTNVVRATNQMDGTINPSQAYGGTLTGTPSPAPIFNQSNYYAQGFSAGVLFRY
jgi:hypothetical protein